MKLFDTFLFFNELDLLELRLNTLDPFVDHFVITEATETFAGAPKPLLFAENRERFRAFESKIIHNVISYTPRDFRSWSPPGEYYTDRTRSYPHKSGGTPLERLSISFQREVYQRDSIINGLLGRAQDSDLILISDLDEIPNPNCVAALRETFSDDVYVFRQRWYMYYFNVLCKGEWFGTRACAFSHLHGRSVDLMRFHLEDRAAQIGTILEDGGWHFSFLGGAERVREKLRAYSYQGRRSRWLLRAADLLFPSRIEKKIASNSDIFYSDRKFETVPLDAGFPPYLLANRERYAQLIKA